MDDGSLLIRGSIDGPFEPIVKVKGVTSVLSPTLMQHQLEHGRPATRKDTNRQDKIKTFIKEMQSKNPSLTFVQAWTSLQQKGLELFD